MQSWISNFGSMRIHSKHAGQHLRSDSPVIPSEISWIFGSRIPFGGLHRSQLRNPNKTNHSISHPTTTKINASHGIQGEPGARAFHFPPHETKTHPTNMNKTLLTIFACAATLGGCTSLTPQQSTALTATASALESALSGTKGTADITAGLDAAQVIYQAYQGQTIPASSISTGVQAVDNVLQSYTGSTPVTAADVATISNVIAAFTAPKVTPTP
jgi:hypothetical protein